MQQAVILLLVVVVLLLYFWPPPRRSVCTASRSCWTVMAEFADSHDAAQLLDTANQRLLIFLRHLRDKYYVDLDDATMETIMVRAPGHRDTDKYKIISAILRDYDPSTVMENDPRRGGETSYNINKGGQLVICLREKVAPYRLVDINTLMYVMLHEVGGHIGSYDVWGHPERFWEVFKFILREAVEAGVYRRVDYTAHPTVYCGLRLDYQPLDDAGIADI